MKNESTRNPAAELYNSPAYNSANMVTNSSEQMSFIKYKNLYIHRMLVKSFTATIYNTSFNKVYQSHTITELI